MMSIDITVHIYRDLAASVNVILTGIIDLHVTQKIENKLSELIQSGYKYLALSMENVKYIDSVGLRVLIDVNNKAKSQDGLLILISPSPIVQRVLEITALTRIIKVCVSENEAKRIIQNRIGS